MMDKSKLFKSSIAYSSKEVEDFRKLKLDSYQINKKIFPNVLEKDLNEISRLANNKLSDLQRNILVCDRDTFSFPTVDESMKELGAYLRELAVIYDSKGLEKIYNKIEKVLDVIIKDGSNEYNDDLIIIKEIKKEYVETKKMNKSSMLYLNKIYKQLMIEENDNGKTSTPPKDDEHWRGGTALTA